MRIPFRSDFVSLNLSLVFSIVAAVLLRSVEVLLLSIWPNLSRFNLSKRVYNWVRHSLPGSSIKQVTWAKLNCNNVSWAEDQCRPSKFALCSEITNALFLNNKSGRVACLRKGKRAFKHRQLEGRKT